MLGMYDGYDGYEGYEELSWFKELKERFTHYTLGVADVDAEHFYMLVLLHKLKKCTDRGEIVIKFAELLHWWETHAATEDRFMKSINYPYREPHMKHHEFIASVLNGLTKKCMQDPNNTLNITVAVDTFITKLIDHLDHEDRQFADYVKV